MRLKNFGTVIGYSKIVIITSKNKYYLDENGNVLNSYKLDENLVNAYGYGDIKNEINKTINKNG